ncbi:NAD(P)/FAD-dependent oxidoreductase [Actinokineospora bangkokensis]|uniref:NADH:ubiquinone reductase (non-electrogenic) n=1 Tax=Actinokineospora bangkokensis TaxID=1193682 RepID=A0A1Q9LNP3_9PSEU|nr:NAD(P)/FAD-dependent oxidoreductase [Actinokineospora bangkokensis]OLR93638.1 FAD-dependent oxidoreductase [Actinokineospora bangkokensis]
MTEHATAGGAGGRHRVVIIGSGFGGLFAARNLRKAPVDVTLIASTGHHLFQPLLYQVATGVLSEGEIAPATREILRRQDNATVLLGHVTHIDVERKVVVSRTPVGETTTPYDSLIVAAGAGQSYFGNDQFAEYAPGMKSIDDALELRGRIFGAFEIAEVLEDPAEREQWLTFVVVGAGPTGVEMVGQIAELAGTTLQRDFRRIESTSAKVILLDAAPAVLGPFGDKLSRKAKQQLERLGVDVQLGVKVVGVDSTGVDVIDPDGSPRRITARTKVWAAGVAASPLARLLADQTGAEVDRAGRVKVNPDTSLPGHPEVFAVGDMMTMDKPLPGVAQVAMQQGKYAARTIAARLAGKPELPPFHYRDKGNMATVSRFHAVASVGSKIRLAGFIAWLMWLAVHLVYLIGFKNRVTTLLHWTVTFIGRARSERIATEQQIFARMAIQRERTKSSADAVPVSDSA